MQTNYPLYAELMARRRVPQGQTSPMGLGQQMPPMPSGYTLSSLLGSGSSAPAASGSAAPASGASGAGAAPFAGAGAGIAASGYGLWELGDDDSALSRVADNKWVEKIPYTQIVKQGGRFVRQPQEVLKDIYWDGPRKAAKFFGRLF